jgi:hypothetical protein
MAEILMFLQKYYQYMEIRGNKILFFFADNEAKVASLYERYAELFPPNRQLWEKIAEDEHRHTEIFRDLNSFWGENEKSIKITKHSLGILKYIGSFVDEQSSIARSGRINTLYALETALRLEQSMIEKKCFEMFAPRSKEMYEAFRRVNHETNQHRDLFQKELKKLIATK